MGQDFSSPSCKPHGCCSCSRNDEINFNSLTPSRHAAMGSSGYETAGASVAASSPKLFPGAAIAVDCESLNPEKAHRISTSSTQLASSTTNNSPEAEKRNSHISICNSLESSTRSGLSQDSVEASSSDSDCEIKRSPRAKDDDGDECGSEGGFSVTVSEVLVRPRMARRKAICAGTLEKHVFQPPVHNKDEATNKTLRKALESCSLFRNMLSNKEMEDLVKAFSIVNVEAGTRIVEQGAAGDALFAVVEGGVDCYLERPGRASSPNRLAGGRRPSDASNASDWSSCSSPKRARRHSFIATRDEGSLFGEISVVCSLPRSLSVYARLQCRLARLEREVYQKLVVQRQFRKRERREECLRSVKLLELLTDEHIAKLADALREKTFSAGEVIIHQGEQGEDFFIVQSGECVATVKTYDDVQEVKRYYDGDLFGELALLKNAKRAATITAVTNVEAMYIKRRSFERMLGPLSNMMKSQYIHDPRKLIADFYRPGDHRGPHGSLRAHGMGQDVKANELEMNTADSGRKLSIVNSGDGTLSHSTSGILGPTSETVTHWLAVFRPTSRDAIAKMLGGFAVGKGLNVKGKSAKKNRLSGFVPFIQITDNNHKDEIQLAPDGSQVEVYYKTEAARTDAYRHLTKVRSTCEEGNEQDVGAPMAKTLSSFSVAEAALEKEWSKLEHVRIAKVDSYAPKVFGLRLSGNLLREAYIMRPDLTALVGWETGRSSEPAFMDMNLSAVCNNRSDPQVVLIQHDEGDSMNPHGLLIAYAETTVKPVVSDFDAFLIASRGMEYDVLPDSQASLMSWSLDRATEILQNPGEGSWTSRWLEVLKREAQAGFHPEIPKYGFGDITSYRLIADVINQTSSCGAVRHGAECFNFYFPQELDEQYLVVWEGFPEKPWDYKSEPELRSFLMDRAKEGFCFPLNPIWPIRDPGWYEVWQTLRSTEAFSMPGGNLDSWYPPDSGVAAKIDSLHAQHPGGFVRLESEDASTQGGSSFCGDEWACAVRKSRSRDSTHEAEMSRAMNVLQKLRGRRTSGRLSRVSRMATGMMGGLFKRDKSRNSRLSCRTSEITSGNFLTSPFDGSEGERSSDFGSTLHVPPERTGSIGSGLTGTLDHSRSGGRGKSRIIEGLS